MSEEDKGEPVPTNAKERASAAFDLAMAATGKASDLPQVKTMYDQADKKLGATFKYSQVYFNLTTDLAAAEKSKNVDQQRIIKTVISAYYLREQLFKAQQDGLPTYELPETRELLNALAMKRAKEQSKVQIDIDNEAKEETKRKAAEATEETTDNNRPILEYAVKKIFKAGHDDEWQDWKQSAKNHAYKQVTAKLETFFKDKGLDIYNATEQQLNTALKYEYPNGISVQCKKAVGDSDKEIEFSLDDLQNIILNARDIKRARELKDVNKDAKASVETSENKTGDDKDGNSGKGADDTKQTTKRLAVKTGSNTTEAIDDSTWLGAVPEEGFAKCKNFDENPDAVQIQKLQLGLMRSGGKFTKYHADGLFGDETEAEVIAFQTANKMKVTGKFDKQTIAMIQYKEFEAMSKLLEDGTQDKGAISAQLAIEWKDIKAVAANLPEQVKIDLATLLKNKASDIQNIAVTTDLVAAVTNAKASKDIFTIG